MSPGKGLVLDANILIRAVLGKRVRSILENYEDSAEFYTPDVCLEEAREHLPAILESLGIERHSCLAVLREIELLVQPVDRESLPGTRARRA
jgi:predicted nucleic acid-binding protein